MRRLVVVVAVLVVASALASACPEAILGSRFADAYVAFAPLGELYRSFGDHLFIGSAIVVPEGIASSCAETLAALQALHEELVLYTADAGEALGAVVRLRAKAEFFCSEFDVELASLAGIATADGVAEESEAGLVAASFFANIRGLDLGFEEALDAALWTVGDEPRWVIALCFSLRSLLLGADPIRLPNAAELAVLFYGSEFWAVPRFVVPASVEAAMAALVAAAGRDLTAEEAVDVRRSAEAIYEYFVVVTISSRSDLPKGGREGGPAAVHLPWGKNRWS